MERHYRAYDAAGWTFPPSVFLAELQTECALQCECVGDNPAEVLHMFATRSCSEVACTVAVGTAMRLVGSARDGPITRSFRRGASYTPFDHLSEVPLFLRGSEGSPFFWTTLLHSGLVEFVEGIPSDGSS